MNLFVDTEDGEVQTVVLAGVTLKSANCVKKQAVYSMPDLARQT